MNIIKRVLSSGLAISTIGLIGCSSQAPFVGEAIYGTKPTAPATHTHDPTQSLAMNLVDASGFRVYLESFNDIDTKIYGSDQSRQAGNALALQNMYINGFTGMGVASLLLSAPEWRHYNYDWAVTFLPISVSYSAEELKKKSPAMNAAIESYKNEAVLWAKEAYSNIDGVYLDEKKNSSNTKSYFWFQSKKIQKPGYFRWPTPTYFPKTTLYSKGYHSSTVNCPVFLDDTLTNKKCLIIYSQLGDSKTYIDKNTEAQRGMTAINIYTNILAPHLPDNSFIWVAGSKHRNSPPFILTNKGRHNFIKPN